MEKGYIKPLGITIRWSFKLCDNLVYLNDTDICIVVSVKVKCLLYKIQTSETNDLQIDSACFQGASDVDDTAKVFTATFDGPLTRFLQM